MATPPLARHAISYVRVHADSEPAEARGNVFCTQRGQTLPISECARCPRFVRVNAGTAPAQEEVLCAVRTSLLPVAEGSTPLSLARLPVSALMTRNVICIRPDLTLDAAAQLFVESSLKAVPVVEADGRLIGFISESEVMLAIHVARTSPEGSSPSAVADIMLPFALALPETASVTQAAAIMAFEGQQRIAVVSSSGAVVGILSASDVMYWLARSDGHLLPRPRAC